MRTAFAHAAQIILGDGAHDAAPGGAVTVRVCGALDHESPCPLAPHHTSVARHGDQATVRVVFAAEATDEQRVRDLIDQALTAGVFTGPDGRTSRWTVPAAGPDAVRADEDALASRLSDG